MRLNSGSSLEVSHPKEQNPAGFGARRDCWSGRDTMRVLLVDDEDLALDRLKTFFADIEGVEVVGQAQDGAEALEAISRLTPDLVLLDIQMPGRNGLRAAAEIQVEPRPEVIFVTDHEHYAPDAFDVDAADYL